MAFELNFCYVSSGIQSLEGEQLLNKKNRANDPTLNIGTIPVRAIIPTKSTEDEATLLERLVKHDHRVHTTTIDEKDAVITSLPLSSDYPRDNGHQVNFHIPSILRGRKGVRFSMNLHEEGGMSEEHNINNFAQVVCAMTASGRAKMLNALAVRNIGEQYGPIVVFGVEEATVIVANIDDMISINHITMSIHTRIV